MQLFAGKPSKFHSKQVTFSADELAKMLGDTSSIGTGRGRVPKAEGEPELSVIPGMLLNRLNPLKGLDDEQRKAFISEFRHKSEAFGNRDLRLALMDEQGIDKALMFPAAAHDIEYEFVDNIDALYANIRAFNRWMHEEVGFVADNRMFLPPYIALADPELAVKELEQVIADGATMVQTKSGHAHGGAGQPLRRPLPGRPDLRPLLVDPQRGRDPPGRPPGRHRLSEVRGRLVRGPRPVFGDFDAFQWMMYWGDRPAMEITAGLILHNFFGRFPNIKVCLSELGTVWLPYTMRKMDHAFMMGRKAKWAENGRLDRRPSEIFREHFVVAPTPRRTCSGSSPRSGSNPSSSARTSLTARVWPSRPVRRRPAEQLLRRRSTARHAGQSREIPGPLRALVLHVAPVRTGVATMRPGPGAEWYFRAARWRPR